jgi:hypothetical protein
MTGIGICGRCGAARVIGQGVCSSCGAPADGRGSVAGGVSHTAVPEQTSARSAVASSAQPLATEAPPVEHELSRTQFSPHTILTQLKVTLVVTNRRVIVHRPNTLFGIFQCGYVERFSSLAKVAEVTSGDQLSSRKIASGVVCALLAIMMFASQVMPGAIGIVIGLVLLGLAVFEFASARTRGVFVRNVGGGVLAAPAGRMDGSELDRAKQSIEHAVLRYGVTSVASTARE